MLLYDATTKLKQALSQYDSFNAELNEYYSDFAQALLNENPDVIDDTILDLMLLVKTLDLQKGSNVSLICGNLAENGFPVVKAATYFTEFYAEIVDKAYPFFSYFFEKVDSSIKPDDEERDDKMLALFNELTNEIVDNETNLAIQALTKFYHCAVALFSGNAELFFAAKKRFGEKAIVIGRYNQGCYWLSKLFTTLFDEPLLVIDIDNKKGFIGRMSGVNDNYQLQHLLMSLSEMNDKIELTEEQMDTVSGYGKQMLESSIVSKWNMYTANLLTIDNWAELINTNEPSKTQNYQSAWIWQEGAPFEIPVYKGYRVVLLGKPSYQRTTRAQRTFSRLEAYIDIEKMLNTNEINEWLGM